MRWGDMRSSDNVEDREGAGDGGGRMPLGGGIKLGGGALTVRLELQADCYAGVWGFYAAKRNLLEPGDVEEGLRAASAVGDDTIQKRTQGYTVPDAFTHGRADQRMRWFRTGLTSGDPRVCNTFAAKDL